MTDSYQLEIAKKLAYDEVNVTQKNPLKELGKLLVQIVLILVCFYAVLYIGSGIILNNLSFDQQVKLEKMLSSRSNYERADISSEQQEQLLAIRDRILSIDKDYPKTSELNMSVINSKSINAMCYVDGTIHITKGLYDIMKSEEELTFIIAHEMGHYKHRDHMHSLRHSLSTQIVLFFVALTSSDNQQISSLASGGINMSNLKYSRVAEFRADRYATEMSNAIYGHANGGIDAMNMFLNLENSSLEIPDFLSTHPNTKARIANIKKHSK